MKTLGLFAAAVCALGVSACGNSLVPDGMFLTLSVSTRGVAVETQINGEPAEFVSGGKSGSMASGMPINGLVHEGSNTVEFALSQRPGGEDIDPGFLATLEISVKGEMVDTADPGERVIFSRELTAEEASALAAGEALTITESFTLSREKLQSITKPAKP